jgi:hypothetical protein
MARGFGPRQVVTLLVLWGWLTPVALVAQSRPRFELGAGVAAVSDSQLPKTTPVSWIAFVERPVNRFLVLVGTVGGENADSDYATTEYYTFTEPCSGTVPNSGVPCTPGGTVQVTRARRGDQTMTQFAVFGGIRVVRAARHFEPFVRFFAGVARVSWHVTLEDLPPGAVPVSPSGPRERGVPGVTSHTSLAVQAGAGLGVRFSDRWQVRVAVEDRRLPDEPRFRHQLQLGAELAVALGSARPSN